jgi:hypothetical protein
MTGTSHMNAILGQGTAIKEVHNVKKQNLETNQQFATQNAEEQKKEEKTKVQHFETTDKIKITGDKEKEERERRRKKKKAKNKEAPEDEPNRSEGNLIDIKV